MELIYKNPGFEYSIHSIMQFQGGEHSEWWLQSLFTYYPQIDRNHLDSLKITDRKAYLYDVLREVYEEPLFSEKIIKYNRHWKIHKLQIEEAFSKAFQFDCHNHFNNIVGNITLNPICPRYLDTCSFDVFYLNSERGALGMALHEMIHFIWFYIWQRHFKDSANEYETPHLKWVFSEMAVDPIMRNDSRLRDINPYFDDGCAYEYFYQMNIDGKPILETLNNLYQNANMIDFMEQGYAYCVANEEAIRGQMK